DNSPLALKIPQTPARFLKVCAPHGLCLYSTAQRLCYAFGSNIDVVRCGWESGIKSNGKEMFRFAQHDKWRCGFNCTYRIMSALKTVSPHFPCAGHT
ncbi:MAG: hypothetical protein K2N54_03855, partial [Helicobacter sp.]|nr:hypothetical protein [Helicobacter sp.]